MHGHTRVGHLALIDPSAIAGEGPAAWIVRQWREHTDFVSRSLQGFTDGSNANRGSPNLRREILGNDEDSHKYAVRLGIRGLLRNCSSLSSLTKASLSPCHSIWGTSVIRWRRLFGQR